MSRTVTVRLADDLVTALAASARAAGLAPATLAAQMIGAGLRGPADPPADGPLVSAVRAELVDGDPIRTEVLVLLAQQAERGAPAAGLRLLEVLQKRAETAGAEYERLNAELSRELATPRFTFCQACRQVLGDVDQQHGRELLGVEDWRRWERHVRLTLGPYTASCPTVACRAEWARQAG